MLLINKQKDPVFQFLAGTFHQDIESPDDVLQELLTEESKEYLEDAIVFLTDLIQLTLMPIHYLQKILIYHSQTHHIFLCQDKIQSHLSSIESLLQNMDPKCD